MRHSFAMRLRNTAHRRVVLGAGLFAISIAASPGQTIPTAWDEAALASMQTPLRDPARTPRHMASGVYNRIPSLTVYKTYPVYAPGREPRPGYMDHLRQVGARNCFRPGPPYTR